MQPPSNAPQAAATVGAGGEFSASFPGVDLGPTNLAAVDVPSGDGWVRAYVYANDRVFVVKNTLMIQGYGDPGQLVDITVYEGTGPDARWSGSTQAGTTHGWYSTWAPFPEEPNAPQVGDKVAVDLGGDGLLETDLADLSITSVDPASDQISGTAPAGETVTVRLWQDGGYQQTTATAGAGTFTADVGGLRIRDWFGLALADDDGNESALRSGAPFIDVRLVPANNLDCVHWRVDAPAVPVTLSLQTATDTYTRAVRADAAAGGGYGCYGIPEGGSYVGFSAGDTLTVTSPTWEGSLEIAELSWYVDSADDQVTGEAPAGDVEVTVANWKPRDYPAGRRDAAGCHPCRKRLHGYLHRFRRAQWRDALPSALRREHRLRDAA